MGLSWRSAGTGINSLRNGGCLLSPLAQSQHKITHGIATAFGFTAILNVCSLLVITTFIRTKKLAPATAPAPRPQEEAVAS